MKRPDLIPLDILFNTLVTVSKNRTIELEEGLITESHLKLYRKYYDLTAYIEYLEDVIKVKDTDLNKINSKLDNVEKFLKEKQT